jgi:hypothetical protein
LVGQFGLVHLQRAAHSLAMPLRAALYAPQPGPHCRLRDIGPVSMYADEQRRPAG